MVKDGEDWHGLQTTKLKILGYAPTVSGVASFKNMIHNTYQYREMTRKTTNRHTEKKTGNQSRYLLCISGCWFSLNWTLKWTEVEIIKEEPLDLNRI